MLKLLCYPSMWGLPSLTPFAGKVYYFMNWQNIPYEIVHINNPKKGPRGKFPVLDDDGKLIPDSEHIINHLCRKFHIALEMKATDHLMIRMLEEHLVFILSYSRWGDPEGIPVMIDELSRFFPKGLARLLLGLIRRRLKRDHHYQGIGRHTRDEIYVKGINDLKAVEAFLKERQDSEFQLRFVDVVIYAFVETFVKSPLDIPLKGYIESSSILSGYLNEIESSGVFEPAEPLRVQAIRYAVA